MEPLVLFAQGQPEKTDAPVIVFEEKRSKYVAINPDRKHACRIMIDGALIRTVAKKCDAGLWVEEGNRMILIELKRCDAERACDQLRETYTYFQNRYRKQGFRYAFRIVPTRVGVPNLQQRIKQFRRRGFDIKIKETLLQETI